MRLIRRVIPVGALLMAAGCGGGVGVSASGGAPAAPAGSSGDQTLTIGNFVTRVSGTTQQPISVAGYGATISGVAGGTLSSLTLSNPPLTPLTSPQALAQTHLLFNRSSQIYETTPAGGAALPLTGGLIPISGRCAWSPDGTRIVYSQYVSAINQFQLFVMNANGSGATRISDGTASDYAPTWTSVGNKIAFDRYEVTTGLYQIYSMNYNGSGVKRVSDGTSSDYTPAWAPSGDKLAFTRIISSFSQVLIMNSDGSAVHLLSPSYTGYNLRNPAWSPDGAKIAMSILDGANQHIMAMSPDGTNSLTIIGGSVTDDSPAWSPDSLKIAFQRATTGINQIVTVNVDGNNPVTVSDGTADDAVPAWSPYIQSRRLVGSGGLALTAAGFMAGQQGKIVNSLVLFNSTTPNTAFLTTPATLLQGQPSVAITVTADLLTSLLFTNNFSPVSTILGGTTTATGAVVTFDANDGTVSTVLPFNANKAAVKGGNSERKGEELILRQSFTGVWDSRGKNRAPGGASEVHINAQTGQMISFR